MGKLLTDSDKRLMIYSADYQQFMKDVMKDRKSFDKFYKKDSIVLYEVLKMWLEHPQKISFHMRMRMGIGRKDGK